MDAFTEAYVECAIWSESDWRAMHEAGEDNPQPLDENYGPDDLDAETLKEIVEDCEAFQRDNSADLELLYADPAYGDAASAGHDFLLTRNRHGAGFWDRGGNTDALKRLTDASHAYGDFNLDSTSEGKVTAL